MGQDKATTIDEAVRAAVAENPPEMESPESVTSEVQETAPAETKEAAPKEDLGFDPAEARQAIEIVNALKDPVKGKEVIQFLGKQLGLELAEGKTPSQIKKDLYADLKEGIPEEMHFLVDGLKPAIDKMIKAQVEDQVKSIKASQDVILEQESVRRVENAYAQMREAHKDFDEFEKEMGELSEDLPMKPGSDMRVYLERLYKLASSDKKEGQKIAKTVDRINRNAKETHVKSAETSETLVKRGSQRPSLDEAVRAAMQGTRLQ